MRGKRLTSPALAGLLVALMLTGCAVGDPETAPEVPTPARFASATGTAEAFPDAAWWRSFAAPELDRLIGAALAANTDLTAAMARIRQADAAARIAGAALLPRLDATAGGGYSRQGFRGLRGGVTAAENYSAGLNAAWELDLWGGNRAARRSAEASALAERFDRDAVALTVAAGVADTYFRVLSLRDRLRIARANLANARRVQDLVATRVANGAASPLELAQQRTQVASQSAGLPALEQQERQAVNALALLLGRPLDGFAVEADSLQDVRPPPVLAGLPSALLVRRPDLQAAEARLTAAAADIAAARAGLYPSISLTARAGLESDALRSILSQANVVSVALAVLAPIFEGGRLHGQVELSEAQRLELVEAYRGAVLTAFADVEDALIAARQTALREARLRAALAEARRAFALAEAQYRAGAIGLLELLDAQRTLFATEEAAATARLDRLQALAFLYRSLGGGWIPPGDGSVAPQQASRPAADPA